MTKSDIALMSYCSQHHCHCNCCYWWRMKCLFCCSNEIVLLPPCVGNFEVFKSNIACGCTYTSTLLYRIAGASTSSHGELYSPSTAVQRKEWFSPAVQENMHISTATQGILTVLFAVCLYPTVLGLSRMTFSACTTLQTKISLPNRITKLLDK